MESDGVFNHAKAGHIQTATRKDKTISVWLKRSKFASVQWVLAAGWSHDQIQFTAPDALEVSLNATRLPTHSLII